MSRTILFLLAAAALVLPCRPARAGQYPASGAGTLEFTVTPLADKYPAGRDIVLLRAASEDSKENYEVHLAAEDLLVLREFGPCIRTAARVPHNFKKGVPVQIKIAWNGPTGKLYLDGKEADILEPMITDDYRMVKPFLATGGGKQAAVSNVQAAKGSAVDVEEADLKFIGSHTCPKIQDLTSKKPQETYCGVALVNFPDNASRAKIKSFLDLLPPAARAQVKRVDYMEPARYAAAPWRGEANVVTGEIFLMGDSADSARLFFHEAAHIYDYTHYKASGQLWSKEFGRRFINGHRGAVGDLRDASVLNRLDGSSAMEEFADRAGITYESYIDGTPERLDAFQRMENTKELVAFLLETGYITRPMSDKLNGGGK